MGKEILTGSDYDKLLYFISKLTENKENYQHKVLVLLDEVFDFKYTTFNLIDKKTLNLYCPIVNNITDNAVEQYYQHYFKTDIFHPSNNHELFFNKSLLSINDIMPYSEYENTEYYNDFLKTDMLYYQLAIPLKYENMLLGGIGVFKPKEEDSFNKKELAILSTLNKYISDELYKFLQIEDIKKDYQIYNHCFHEIPTGIMILNKNKSLLYLNKTAENICKELLPSKKKVESVNQLVSEIFPKMTLKMDLSKNIQLFKHRSYYFQISSTIITTHNNDIDPVYVIYITKDMLKKSLNENDPLIKYNLTVREMEIIDLVKQGLTNNQIAQRLYISKHTVKTHLENIFKKLNVKNRTALIYKVNNLYN